MKNCTVHLVLLNCIKCGQYLANDFSFLFLIFPSTSIRVWLKMSYVKGRALIICLGKRGNRCRVGVGWFVVGNGKRYIIFNGEHQTISIYFCDSDPFDEQLHKSQRILDLNVGR